MYYLRKMLSRRVWWMLDVPLTCLRSHIVLERIQRPPLTADCDGASILPAAPLGEDRLLHAVLPSRGIRRYCAKRLEVFGKVHQTNLREIRLL